LLPDAAGSTTTQKSQAILPRRPPRTANPLSPLPPRGLWSSYRPQQHAVFVLCAEALRTCRAAQSLHASLRVRNRGRCVAFAPSVFPSVRSSMSSPRRPPRGPSLLQRFLFPSPGDSSGTDLKQACSLGTCTLLLGSGGRTPQAHMPVSISLTPICTCVHRPTSCGTSCSPHH
jgi:hypothetical protein